MSLAYCLTCKKQTDILNEEKTVTANNRNMIKGNCSVCNRRISQFIAGVQGEGKKEVKKTKKEPKEPKEEPIEEEPKVEAVKVKKIRKRIIKKPIEVES